MSNKGKRYDQEFKADIVRLVREEKRSVASIVTDFGISQQTVRKWSGESKTRENPDKVLITELQAEIKANHKKLADHELTIDILKKATAIFAKDNRR
jgi:transposase-like protein